MKISVKCFNDQEIVSRIESFKKYGDCNITGRKNVLVYDTDSDDYLQGIFNKVLSSYTTDKNIIDNTAADKKVFIKDDILQKWNIFNEINASQAYQILKALSSDLYESNPALFDEPVVDIALSDTPYLERSSILKGKNWEDFVNELKHDNRFHTNFINEDKFKILCTYMRKVYKKGTKFYRGRIVDKKCYTKNEMGAPPQDKASEGRANSTGISRLYLASDKKTTLHELRAGAYDLITIGVFELLQDIVVVDMKMIDKISPFIEGLDPRLLSINRECLNKINEEISKPLRKNDSSLDYVPTQYIVDLIHSFTNENKYEYDGVEYKSTLNPSGFNLAIFNPKLCRCKRVFTYRVSELNYLTDPKI